MVTATWNGIVLARSDATKVVEGTHFFPPESVHHKYLRLSQSAHGPPDLGLANYYTVQDGVKENPNAAWSYLELSSKAEDLGIAGYVAFRKGVHVR